MTLKVCWRPSEQRREHGRRSTPRAGRWRRRTGVAGSLCRQLAASCRWLLWFRGSLSMEPAAEGGERRVWAGAGAHRAGPTSRPRLTAVVLSLLSLQTPRCLGRPTLIWRPPWAFPVSVCCDTGQGDAGRPAERRGRRLPRAGGPRWGAPRWLAVGGRPSSLLATRAGAAGVFVAKVSVPISLF